MRALIFGIGGQDGYYLQKLLEQENIEVIGVSRSNGAWLQGDIADMNNVASLIKELKPNYIFHLAANSTTKHDALFENHQSIVTGTLNILEACLDYNKDAKIFLSGSAVQFQNDGKPINEVTPFAAYSPYAVSRIASVYAGRYFRSLGLHVYVGYFFHHDSPLRTEKHINKKIVAATKRIALGSDETILIGDLSVKKEFNFAGDFAEAVWTLVNQENAYEAVIGSGKAHSIAEWIQICFDIAKLDWRKYIIQKQDYTPEFRVLVSNPELIISLGWKSKVNIRTLAKLMYNN